MTQPWPDEAEDDDDDAADKDHSKAHPWWTEALRSAFFIAPRWHGLRATPALVLGLMAASTLFSLLAYRLYIVGPAQFYWPALLSGWFATVMIIGACWCLAPDDSAAAPQPSRAPSGSALFAMLVAQSLVCGAVVVGVMAPLARQGMLGTQYGSGWVEWLAWGAPLLWSLGIAATLLWRGGHGSRALRAGAVAAMVIATLLSQWGEPMRPWYAEQAQSAEVGDGAPAARFEWTQSQLEAQAQTLPRRSQALAAQRPGVVDLYALTFAPYSTEDVFLRESRLVAEVVGNRFGAQERSIQLINHHSTAAEWPWATPANLQRAIGAMAQRMDRDEDVLFVHLTSHGAKSARLAASFWPIRIDELTPADLKAALDAAGVRFRVISVSACYAGSWVAPLADEDTLVMTAADAEHTSYGCGRRSELTYFGRAVYDEALRQTWSFESALASARPVIEQREKDAGKSDGFSNPQIHVGAAVRERLRLLEQQQAAASRQLKAVSAARQ